MARSAEDPVVLADIVRPEAASFADVKRDYPFLANLKVLLGATPNCSLFMSACPPVLHSYFVLVPNLLHLPNSMLGIGGVSIGVKSLAMFASSKSVGCNYCSLHVFSLGLRRGLPEEAFSGCGLSPQESAVTDLGVALGPTPCEMKRSVYDNLTAVYNSSDVEWVMLATCMMGWLNRFMHVVGVDLEEALVDECRPQLEKHGWNTGNHAICPPLDALQEPSPKPLRGDDLGSVLSILANTPSAMIYDVRMLSGTPGGWPACGHYLEQHLGHDFSVLGRLQHSTARKAITFALKEMLTADSLTLCRRTKYLIGVAFSAICENSDLEMDMRKMLDFDDKSNALTTKTACDAVLDIARKSGAGVACDDGWVSWCSGALQSECSIDSRDAAAIVVALASSTAPPRITPAVLKEARDHLEPSAIIEVAGWMSLLTLLNRMMCYFAVVV